MREDSCYTSPLSKRYSSPEMSYIFSPQKRALAFRSLWVALAKIEKKLGLPITPKQIEEMEKNISNIDFAAISEYEKRFRHDVMAHIYAFGDAAPSAKPIIHLGATSCFVTDNADLILMKEALSLLFSKLLRVIEKLALFSKKYAKSPCLSYTHYQSAQPTTIGKRAALWLQDFYIDASTFEKLIEELPFLGAKGATGTQSSFLTLFQGDVEKVKRLDTLLAKEFGFKKPIPLSGQTYSRKIDLILLNALGSFAASAHKFATDIRLLAHDKEMLESFSDEQVGSSAMPYKRNPIYSERISGIARFVISLSQNGAYTAATQWLERSLDDSSNRRLSLPEAFLGADALLSLLYHLVTTLTPCPKTSLERLNRQLPSLILENVLMAAVNKGGDRQELHERLKKLSFKADEKKDPLGYLLDSIEKEGAFSLSKKELTPLMSLSSLIGRAPDQVLLFLKEEINPLLSRHKKKAPPIPKVEI